VLVGWLGDFHDQVDHSIMFVDDDDDIPHSDVMSLPPLPKSVESVMSLPGSVDECEWECPPSVLPSHPSPTPTHVIQLNNSDQSLLLFARIRECIAASHIMCEADMNPLDWNESMCARVLHSARDIVTLQDYLREQGISPKLKQFHHRSVRPQSVAELCFLIERWLNQRAVRKTAQQRMEEAEERLQLEQWREKRRQKSNSSDGGADAQLSALITRLLSSVHVSQQQLTHTQRHSIASALYHGQLLQRSGANQVDIEEFPLELLLPLGGGVGGPTRLIDAIHILSAAGIRAQSFEQLLQLISQHWAHATPQRHIIPDRQKENNKTKPCVIQ
jgi:hypothetical protein